jgi:hypothetical protein
VPSVAEGRRHFAGNRALQEGAGITLEATVTAGPGGGALLARALQDLRTDPVLLLLQGVQLGLVGATGARCLGLRRPVPDDQVRDLGLGGSCGTLEALTPDEVGASLLTLCGDGLLGLLDLRLLRDHLGTGLLEVREERGLLAHQRVDRVHLAGHLGGVRRVEHHREAHQLRVTVRVVAGGELADRCALYDDPLPGGIESHPSQGQLVLGGLEAGLHQGVEPDRFGDLGLRLRQSHLRRGQSGSGAVEPTGSRGQGLAGLVEITLGIAHLVAHLALPVPEVLGHRVRSDGADPGDQQDRAREDRPEPDGATRGGGRLRSGEGAHVAVQ